MNTLIKDITAILPDGDGFKTEKCDICITGDTITKIGKAEDFAADKIIDGKGRLASAGLVTAVKSLIPGGAFVATLVKGVVDTCLFVISYQIQKRWVFKN